MMFDPFGSFDLFFPMFYIVFFMILIIFFVQIVRGIRQWNKNNHSPKLSVPATVVARSTSHSYHKNSHTTYYHVTFEVESGDRMEFTVSSREYGMLAERDQGKLTFQGTRYLGFERTRR